MINPTTKSYISLLSDLGLNGEPCDEWDVQDLEQQQGVELPPAFNAFLLIAGISCEPLEGSQYAYEDDKGSLQHSGRRVMKKDKTNFFSDAFVFLVHQGYAFNFFLLHDSEDLPIYEYV